MCLQETKELGTIGFKLEKRMVWYYCRQVLEIVQGMQDELDTMLALKLLVAQETTNIISTYASQVGLQALQKKSIGKVWWDWFKAFHKRKIFSLEGSKWTYWQ